MKKIYIETYGCQMNVNDSGIVSKVLTDSGFTLVENLVSADVILINTCSVRDNAEARVKKRLAEIQSFNKKNKQLTIGIIGCMAERLREDLIDNHGVDFICGVDSYRNIANIIMGSDPQPKNNTETYDDIMPLQMDKSKITAFVSIMRGCNNFCSYCVVPYTRGRERSRDCQSIIKECEALFANGYREITLLGQNVNSYHYETIDFAMLIAMVADINPLLRVRFATSHPKDISDKLIDTIASHSNICKMIHLPVQSGSNAVLENMNRHYTREDYINKISKIRAAIPDCAISTDIIVGFCGETQEDFEQTYSIMSEVGYDYAFMFAYSERPNTLAAKKYTDNVSPEEKNRRLTTIIKLQHELSLLSNKRDIGTIQEVLVEGVSKRSTTQFFGRNSQNKVVVFDNNGIRISDYVKVQITDCTSATLIGKIIM